MLCQKETGVLPGSEIFFHTVGASTQRLLYYISFCGHYYCERGYKIRRSQVNNLLLMLVDKGALRLEYRGRSDTVVAGELLLIDCTEPHYYAALEYVEIYWMHIAGANAFELCAYLTSARDSVVHHAPDSDRAGALVRLLVSQYANNQPVSDAEQSRLLYNILCYLIAGASAATAGEPTGPVQEAMAFIQAHLREDLRLKRLAAHVYLSPSHLIRLFRAQTQQSPHEYVILCRMDRAKYLLKTTDLPVKRVAAEVGYRSESSFTAAFTERIGISPRAFRMLPLG
ncbi:helix-turn-helix domain-containing protein [Agathobaculum sp. Marseille-P7918]|uniref:helix-turn-helix domain-containing protein n=1 Tax=Agathobaculum sp. Marseille-P7918 TaxID=2479843 RepID=UPI00356761C3